jgi:hypothetical protein
MMIDLNKPFSAYFRFISALAFVVVGVLIYEGDFINAIIVWLISFIVFWIASTFDSIFYNSQKSIKLFLNEFFDKGNFVSLFLTALFTPSFGVLIGYLISLRH